MAKKKAKKKSKKKALAVPSKEWSITVTVTKVGGTNNDLVGTWRANKKISNFSTYSYEWWYGLPGIKSAIKGGSGTQANTTPLTYTMPDNATYVILKVKAVAKNHKVTWKEDGKKKSKDVAYWTDSWKPSNKYTKTALTAPVPTVSLDKTKLTLSVSNLSPLVTKVDFNIIKDNTTGIGVFQDKTKTVSGLHYAELEREVELGHSYKARCRVYINNGTSSDWSDLSDSTGILPKVVPSIDSITPLSSTSIKLSWAAAMGATSYDVEYADDISVFESGSPQSASTENTSMIVEGLDRGKRWYFRVRAARDSYKTPWTPGLDGPYPSIVLGQPPAAPTTYSISNTIRVGGKAYLYWVHNAEDDSTQIRGQVHLEIHTGSSIIELDETVDNEFIDNDLKKDDNLFLEIDTDDPTRKWAQKGVHFDGGMYILWKVRTMGITEKYGSYSVIRRLDIIDTPSLTMTLEPGAIVEAFPITLHLAAGPAAQKVLGYSIEVLANSDYDDYDYDGTVYQIAKGDKIYSEFITTNQSEYEHVFTPANINLHPNVSYKVNVDVSMDSGLTANSQTIFTTQWAGFSDDVVPTAEYYPFADKYAMVITPFCYDSEDVDLGEDYDPEEDMDVPLTENVTLSVYRIGVDGEPVEIRSGIPNDGTISVIDPHPAFSNLRYRIVATNTETGEMAFGHPPVLDDMIDASGIVITWGEKWDDLQIPRDMNEGDALEDEGYYGDILKLPYNTSISENHQVDKSLVNYIGRRRPVGYYGTQLGETATWKAEFAKDDTDIDPNTKYNTLALVRQLAVYPGDVYVRESNGSGYWASIDVSFDLSYNSAIVPVTFNVTRVEGGA